jgi:pimeloyl-ACP methyl ester carboxylesterase
VLLGLVLAVVGFAPQSVATATGGATPAPDPDAFRVEVHGAGRPMILIPGLTSSGAVWDATVAHFADRYEVHVLTLAGFAGVPPVAHDDFLAMERDAVLDYIRTEGLERPVMVGHSLGGVLAYWIAATDPGAVGPVVAVDGVPFLPALQQPDADESTMSAQAEQMATFYATMSEEQMRQQSRMAAQAMVSDGAAVDTIAAWGARSDGATAGRAFAEMMTTDLRDEVAEITSPLLLVMAGGGMPDAARERTRTAYEAQISAAPRGRVVVATDARHFVMLDDPAFLHDAIERFLNEAGSGAEADARAGSGAEGAAAAAAVPGGGSR